MSLHEVTECSLVFQYRRKREMDDHPYQTEHLQFINNTLLNTYQNKNICSAKHSKQTRPWHCL